MTADPWNNSFCTKRNSRELSFSLKTTSTSTASNNFYHIILWYKCKFLIMRIKLNHPILFWVIWLPNIYLVPRDFPHVLMWATGFMHASHLFFSQNRWMDWISHWRIGHFILWTHLLCCKFGQTCIDEVFSTKSWNRSKVNITCVS